MAVSYELNGEQVQLTQEDVKKYLVSGDANKVTDKEFKMFMELCKAQKLNPFLREAYLIKFGQDANIIVGKDVFLKRAKANPTCKGFKAGIIVQNEKGLENREGTFYMPDQERLVGGWSTVFIDGWAEPFEHTVSFAEFNKGTATWKNMPAIMIRKTALVQALREAFPEDLQALYDQDEMGIEVPNEKSASLANAVNDTFVKHHGYDYPVEIEEDATEAEFEEVSETILPEQQKFLFQVAKGNNDLVKEVLDNYGFKSTAEIENQYYGDIVQDIEEAIKVVGE